MLPPKKGKPSSVRSAKEMFFRSWLSTKPPSHCRVFFSPSAADYPAGTRSIALKLNEHGLRAEPSTRIIPNPVP